MRLIRLAILALQSSSESWRNFSISHEGVDVSLVDTGDSPGDHVLLVAHVPLGHRPDIDDDGLVQVPEAPRRQAEAALQIAANLLSVATGGARTLSSPALPVAFLAENDDERHWLTAQQGLANLDTGLSRPDFTVLLEERHLGELSDRLEGVALLAEALASPHLTGRFHELVRLFELGFSASGNGLVVPVAAFLGDWPLFAYTKTEVKRWLIRLRNPATHVDRSARHGMVLEADLGPVISRMTLAAYDVLLNKLSWGDGSTDRRDVWRPDTGPLTPDGLNLFVCQHSTPRTDAQILDRFGAFPLNLKIGGAVALGADCWPRTPPSKTTASQGQIRVVPAAEIQARRGLAPDS